MDIHREGYRFIAMAGAFWLVIFAISFLYLGNILWLAVALNLPAFALLLWVVWFFRIPDRKFTSGKKHLIAPADGKIVVIEETFEKEYFKDMRLQVSIFMSPMDVHINRSPLTGDVKFFRYHKGSYLVAWHPKSSTENERTTVVIGNENADVLLRQIAGAVARRVCCYVQQGDRILQNREFGFIRFGSRVDLFLPLGTQMQVKIGDRVKGGVTILASDVVDHHPLPPDTTVVVGIRD
jgi:phosphatidylserine decarboxylase